MRILESVNILLSKWPCHKIPDRCLVIGGVSLRICSRCFGIVVGIVVGLFLTGFGAITFDTKWEALMLVIPLLIDAGTQEAKLRVSNNLLRLATGFFGGVGGLLFLASWIKQDLGVLF